MRLVIVCMQRPLCQCPTLGEGKSRLSVFVLPNGTIKDVKLAIQQQLNRNSTMNAESLDPARQVLLDPNEGFELQDHMPHGFRDSQSLRLNLRRLAPPTLLGPSEWNGSFVRAQTLARPQEERPNRPIRDVALETSIFRTGGTKALAASFAVFETRRLQEFADTECTHERVPELEWQQVTERPAYLKSAAGTAALELRRSNK
jgi:hypothetical protein